MILPSIKSHRTQNMRTAPQRRILQSENRTAVWCYIVKTHANENRLSSSLTRLTFQLWLSSFRVGELFFESVPSSPSIMLMDLTGLARARLLVQNFRAVKFVSYTLYVLPYPFSLFFGVNIPKVLFRLEGNIGITSTPVRNVCTFPIFRNAGAVKGTMEGKHSIRP